LTRIVYQRMGRRRDARAQHEQTAPAYHRRVAPESVYGLLPRCLSGAAPDGQARLSDDDVRTFLDLRNDPEPLYLWASDLKFGGDTAGALTLLRESIRRNYGGAAAMATDPTFAAIRDRAEYAELLGAAEACRHRFREHVRARAP
jgi:hypothetical protein